MVLPPPHDTTATHTLLSDDYPTAFRTLFAAVARHATDAFVRLDRTELDHDVDNATRCRRVWDDVQPAFTLTGAIGSADDTSWYRTALPANADALDRLLELVDGHVGTFFVHTVALAAGPGDRGPDDCRWLARAVPHHSIAVLTDDEPALVAACDDALAPLRACVVEAGTKVEWTADGRRYRVAGGLICRETPDGRRSACFGLTGLRYVDRSDERTIRLTWRRPDRPDNRLLATLASVVDRLSPDAPTVLRVTDEATADKVAAVFEDLLERYEPAQRNAERAA